MFLMPSTHVGRQPPRTHGAKTTSFNGISGVLQLHVLLHSTTATIPADQAQLDSLAWPSQSTTLTSLAVPVATSLEVPRNSATHGVAAGATPGEGMTLFKQVHGFVLSGNHEPFLREINGGRNCENPAGIRPPGWRLHGFNLDLETCARTASAQEHVVGFKWGSEVYNYSAYMRIAQSEAHGQLKPRAPVQLAQLYPPDTEFKCEIFMVDKWGNIPKLKLDHLENQTTFQSRRLVAPQLGAATAFHHGITNGAQKQEFHVCVQRRALGKFVRKVVPEFWFCYLPKNQLAKCENDMRDYTIQGIAVFVGGLVVIVPLSYLMQHQYYFMWALVWVTRLVISLMLGVWSVWFLLHLGVNHELPSLGLSFLALLLVIVGNTIALLPYEFCKACDCCPMLAVAYLLCLVMCPVMFLNWATYINPFIQVVSYGPVPIGLLGFTTELLKDFVCPHFMERTLGCALKQKQTGRLQESEQHRWELDAEDTEAAVVGSTGCFPSVWRMRLRVYCCAESVGAALQLPPSPARPKQGVDDHEAFEHLQTWSGDSDDLHAPL